MREINKPLNSQGYVFMVGCSLLTVLSGNNIYHIIVFFVNIVVNLCHIGYWQFNFSEFTRIRDKPSFRCTICKKVHCLGEQQNIFNFTVNCYDKFGDKHSFCDCTNGCVRASGFKALPRILNALFLSKHDSFRNMEQSLAGEQNYNYISHINSMTNVEWYCGSYDEVRKTFY